MRHALPLNRTAIAVLPLQYASSARALQQHSWLGRPGCCTLIHATSRWAPVPHIQAPKASPPAPALLVLQCCVFTTTWHALKLRGMRSTTLYSAADASQGEAHRTAPASFSCGEASAAGGSCTGACAGRKRRRRPFIGPKGGTHSSFGSTWDNNGVDLVSRARSAIRW